MAKSNLLGKKALHLGLIWLGTALASSVFFFFGLFTSADRLVHDRQFLIFQREYERNDITIITIDDSSLERFSNRFQLHWPWPREMHGEMITFLTNSGVNSIIFDILFDRPDVDRLDTEGPVSDNRMARAMHQSGRVTTAVNASSSGASLSDTLFTNTLPSGLDRHLVTAQGRHTSIPFIDHPNPPIPPVLHAAKRIGNVNVPTREDGVIRSAYLLMPFGTPDPDTGSLKHLPALSLAAYLTMDRDNVDLSGEKDYTDKAVKTAKADETVKTAKASETVETTKATETVKTAKTDEMAGSVNAAELIRINGNRLILDDIAVPLQSDGSYRINWYSRGMRNGTFPYLSYFDVFMTAMAHAQGRPERAPLPADTLAGQNVIIGASAMGLYDIRSTPMSALGPFPGMEIHASILANLLDQNFLRQMPPWIALMLTWLILIPVITGIGTLRHINSIILALFIPLAAFGTGIAAFGLFRLMMPTVYLTSSLILGIGLTYIYRYLTEERQKKVMKSAFSQYVQKEFVDRITEDPSQLRLGGQKKELTVLFSDMANFTSISESLPPEELSDFLNRYLTDMTEIVFKHGGTLDKFIGDAVMAFWGAPIDQPDHAVRACRCALEMQQCLQKRAAEWAQAGYPAVSIRIGINTGPMVVGNMGSKDRFNYTVLGDAVNLGARLEPLNKQYGTSILISEFTVSSMQKTLADGKTDPAAEYGFRLRELDNIKVKGKSRAVTVYELHDRNE